jgi:hypothetical protein
MAVSTVVNFSGYRQGGSASGGPAIVDDDSQSNKDGFWSLEKCIQAYTTYLDSKTAEIQEQQNARRYRHGAQWTAEQVKTLNDRRQPVVTFNKIGPKIDGIVGLVEKLKQDPKAYPRTPIHQEGADLATAVLRYLMDRNKWNEVVPITSGAAAVDGLAGIELDLKQVPPSELAGANGTGAAGAAGAAGMPGMGHNGGPSMEPPPQQPDYDVLFQPVDNDGFFYDPRSMKHDFSDARYIGMGKFVDEELLIELLPDMEEDIKAASDSSELMSNSDRDNRWFQSNGDFKQVRLVDIWYKSKGGWKWTLFTGAKILMRGDSPFVDEHDQQFCKYLMFSAQVDHDGDRYGFVRNLQSPQDEVNQRRSKGLHELNNRRIIATKAAVHDGNVEEIRREAARADGIVLVNTGLQDIQFDDAAKQAALMGQLEMMRDAAGQIEKFGPNPALVGGDAGGGLSRGSSGRAIALLQQAGIAELGPYMLNLRAWKMRVYRALFNSVQKYWINERWIRVTDAQGKPQFVQINAMVLGPDGMPQMQNAIGELDVDIILDEGPDTVTLMQDTYDAISQALPAVAPMLSPASSKAVMDVLIETSPLPADVKKRFRDAGEQEQTQPDPKQAEAQAKLQLEQQSMQGKMQMEGEKAKADMLLKQQSAQLDQQTEREKVMAEIALEREKAQSAMEIEQYKAQTQMQITAAKAQQDAEQRAEQQRQAQEERSAQQAFDFGPAVAQSNKQLDQVLQTLAAHHSMLQGLNKPRRAVIHRDPRTGKVIGAAMVTEG